MITPEKYAKHSAERRADRVTAMRERVCFNFDGPGRYLLNRAWRLADHEPLAGSRDAGEVQDAVKQIDAALQAAGWTYRVTDWACKSCLRTFGYVVIGQ